MCMREHLRSFAAETGRSGLAYLGILLSLYTLSLGGAIISPVFAAPLAWPAGAVFLSALILVPRRSWRFVIPPFALLGLFTAVAAADGRISTLAFLGVQLVESIAEASIIQLLCGERVTFERVEHLMALLVSILVTNPAVAFLSALVTGGLSGASHEVWLRSMAGDALGSLVIAPFLVAWRPAPDYFRPVSGGRFIEGIAFFLAWVAATLFAFAPLPFDHSYVRPYMLIVMLAWAGLRLGIRGTTLANLVLCLVTLMGEIQLHPELPRFWNDLTPGNREWNLQLFVALASVSGLLLASLFVETQTSARKAREAEARLRSVADNLPDRVVYQLLRDFDGTMRFVYVSAGAARLAGFTPEEALADTAAMYSRIHPDDITSLRRAEIVSERRRTNLNASFRIRTLGGELRYLQASSRPRMLPDGRLIWDGMLTDVTEFKAQEALSHARTRVLEASLHMSSQDLLGLVLGEAEKLTLSTAGFFHYIEGSRPVLQKRSSRSGGGEPEIQTSDESLWDQCLKERRAVVRNEPQSSSTSLTPRHAVAVPVMRGDRVAALLTVSGSETEYRAVDVESLEKLADVTWDTIERKRAEESQRAAENLFREAVELLPIPMGIASVSGTTIHYNAEFTRLFGYTMQDLPHIGDFMRLAFPDPGYRAGVMAIFESEIARIGHTGGAAPVREFLVHCKDGTVRSVDITGRIIGDRLISSFVDVTARVKAEEEREMAAENAQRLDKLQSLGVLAGGIAHDFNNLLAGMFGYLDLAQATNLPPRASAYIAKAMNVFARAKHLTEQLLTFSRGGVPFKAVGFVGPVVRESAEFALSGAPLRLEYSEADGVWPCDFDRNQLSQVIDNLVINARQAMPEGGRIKIDVSNINLLPQNVQALPPGDYVKITVQDHGTGISPEVIGRIFDPFFSTKEKGSGLGLATAYSIAARHGGRITVESKPGEGSQFSVFLPAAPGLPLAQSAPHVGAATGSGRILVMDDEEMVREVASAYLEGLGFAVECVPDGEQALSRIRAERNSSDPFRGVIMDLTVREGMGGKAAVDELRKEDAKLPVIAASGYADDPVLSDPVRFGFTWRLRKPFQRSELQEALARCGLI